MLKLQSLKGNGSMLCANTMWGLMSPVAKLVFIGGVIGPLVMTNLRVVGAMLLFWLVSLFMPRETVRPRDHVKLFVASLLSIVFNQGCFILGVSLTSPVDASIITTSMPLVAMVLAAIYLGEPITGRKVMGIAAGAAGALMLIVGGSASASEASHVGSTRIWGDLLVLLAQCSYASYIVLFKNFVSRYSPVTLMKWMFTYSFICLTPFSYTTFVSTEWAALDFESVAGIAYVVVCGTFVPYLLVVVGQKNLRPTVAGMYNYVQPVVGCLAAAMIGLDTLTLGKGFAVLMIFAGVYLVTHSASAKEQAAIQEKQLEVLRRRQEHSRH